MSLYPVVAYRLNAQGYASAITTHTLSGKYNTLILDHPFDIVRVLSLRRPIDKAPKRLPKKKPTEYANNRSSKNKAGNTGQIM